MDEPFLLMVAGPNGAGKTTLIDWLRQQGVDFGEYINPDDIANELEGTYDARVYQAQSIADERREACIEARRSFSFETVMSHPSKIDILVRAKEAGFFVQLFFVGTDDPQTNVARVALRVAQGGHDVPHDKIISRWTRTMEQLFEAVRSSDEAFIFDNSVSGHVVTVPRLVFRRSFLKKKNLPWSAQYSPVPDWVRRYVLIPLGTVSPTLYSDIGYARGHNAIITPSFESTKENETPESRTRGVPRDIESEQIILGAILTSSDRFSAISDFLAPQHFFDPVHQRIFELASRSIATRRGTLQTAIRTLLPADLHIGGLSIDEYFERIITKGSMGVDIIAYGRKIYDLALRRSLIQLCEDLLRSAYADSPDLPLRNLIVEAERRLGILSTDRQQGGLRSFSQTLISAVDTMARTFVRNEGVSGVATGFHDLDRITGGLQPSDLIILAGRPGMGKSAFGMNVAYNAARNWRGEVREDGTIETKAGGIVGFFSLEMSAEQLATRIISAHSEVPSDRIRSGAIATSDFDLVASVAREMEAMPLYIDDTGGLSVAQLAARARRLKRQRGLDLIIVDNVQLLIREPASTAKSHLKQTSEITATLKALAKELSVPILALSQLPQKVDTREDKRPQLSDIFESEVMEQYVDVVLFVYREENYTKFLEPRPGTDEYFRWVTEMEMLHGKAEIIIAKQRYGPTGIVSFQFQADISRFSDIQYR